MRIIKQINLLFYLSVFCFTCLSSTVLFMPFANERIHTVIVGIVFWGMAIVGTALIIMANSQRKWFIKTKMNGNVKMDCRPGIVTFFSNTPATVADVAMIISFVVFVIFMFTKIKYEYASYVALFMFLLSLSMHCLFNGRVYKSTKIKIRRRQDL